VGGCAHHRSELDEKQLGARQRQTYGAEPQGGVHVGGRLERGDEFVAADVERPERHGRRRDDLDDALVDLVLLLLARRLRAVHVEELGPVEADALRPLEPRDVRFRRELDVRRHVDGNAALGGARTVAPRLAVARERHLPLGARRRRAQDGPRR
jgi:hypothetical protein